VQNVKQIKKRKLLSSKDTHLQSTLNTNKSKRQRIWTRITKAASTRNHPQQSLLKHPSPNHLLKKLSSAKHFNTGSATTHPKHTKTTPCTPTHQHRHHHLKPNHHHSTTPPPPKQTRQTTSPRKQMTTQTHI